MQKAVRALAVIGVGGALVAAGCKEYGFEKCAS
jgi:hypothetical protein